ncbi:PHB depolymerase family esterase [Micromonospora sp. NPDC006766]|uniref:extracellular catalytic domain type 1 short-chain-length polyhydroxyalkanoate depolymerase n=1 Tax=Micromonospora sp. NPDC006766 TaxID=3154778 RepID=UPI0033FE197E
MNRPLTMSLAVLVLLLAGCQAVRPAPVPRPTSTADAAASATHRTMVGGRIRTYQVYRPELPAGARVPLVVMLHGALGTGAQARTSYGWDEQAVRDGFVVAYPDGLNRSWAVSDTCCGPSAASRVDEMSFIRQMITEISRSTPIDSSRIFATGISNGGMLAYRLACGTDLFAAIGPVSATMLGTCEKPFPTSVIHIHGGADATIPLRGGPGKRSNNGTGRYPADTSGPPIAGLAETWRQVDRCPQPMITTSGVVTRSVAACPDGRGVTLITITDAGHQWPGQPGPTGAAVAALNLDRPSAALDATATIWNFFAEHPRKTG